MLKIDPPNYQYCPFCGKGLGVRVEEGRKRKFCSSCSWTYYPYVAGSAGAIILRGGKVLMVKRKREPYKGTWMFPAGFVDYGEHPKETVVREVKEETGLEVKTVQFVDVIQADDDPRQIGHFIFLYRVEVEDGEMKTDEEENEDISWVEIKNPPPIGWHGHKLVMKKLQEKKY